MVWVPTGVIRDFKSRGESRSTGPGLKITARSIAFRTPGCSAAIGNESEPPRFRRNRVNRLAHSSCGLLYKMLNQQRNILRRSRRAGPDGKNIQSIVEVAAKLLLQNHSFQVAMVRGHYAYVDFLRPCTSQVLKFPLLQNTEELWLQLERDIADFIQEQLALMRDLKPADLLCDRAGERPPSWPNSSLSSSPVGMEHS